MQKLAVKIYYAAENSNKIDGPSEIPTSGHSENCLFKGK